jgi:anti-sigma B factor antagonist
MTEVNVTMKVRVINPKLSIIDVAGDLNREAEGSLMAAYSEAAGPSTKAVIFNFSGLDFMNSGGIGLIVTLLIRMNRHKQHMLAYGLSEHYQHIFELTRLNEAIGIYDSEAAAAAAAGTLL